MLQVVDTRYQVGRFGSGFKPRPKSDAGIREIPLAPLVVKAIRRQLPPEADGNALVGGSGPATLTGVEATRARRLLANLLANGPFE